MVIIRIQEVGACFGWLPFVHDLCTPWNFPFIYYTCFLLIKKKKKKSTGGGALFFIRRKNLASCIKTNPGKISLHVLEHFIFT